MKKFTLIFLISLLTYSASYLFNTNEYLAMFGEKAASWQDDENGSMIIIITCLIAMSTSTYAALLIYKRSLFSAGLAVILTAIILFRLATIILA